MPVTSVSRHHLLPVGRPLDPAGIPHDAIGLRPPPPAPSGIVQHQITALENLEYLAWRYFGSSEAWWRIADANPTVFPLDLTPGRRVALPAGADTGRVERTRRF